MVRHREFAGMKRIEDEKNLTTGTGKKKNFGEGITLSLSTGESAGVRGVPRSMFDVRCSMFDVSRFTERAGVLLTALLQFRTPHSALRTF
ncbi:MAG: hypothetical protein JWQ04_1450 [Pedosphaera sp.]|nr:hypothetical protein [Pedosphaera sp.]